MKCCKERSSSRRRLLLLSALLISLLLLASGCGAAAPTAPTAPTAHLNAAGRTLLLDPAGNELIVPEDAQRIVSLAPSITGELLELGLGARLVGVDSYSALYWPELASLPQFDLGAPDVEALAACEPELLLVSGMSWYDGADPLHTLRELGICIADIPTPSTLAEIREDVLFIAQCVGCAEQGEELAAQMDAVLAAVKEIGEGIRERKTVLLEVSALPYPVSCGRGTYIDEMIALIGADNVFAGEEGWLAVSEEAEVAADPDVILTCVDYLDDPAAEILGREGWQEVRAVAEGCVYALDSRSINRPDRHIVDALLQMARLVYPEEYAAAGR